MSQVFNGKLTPYTSGSKGANYPFEFKRTQVEVTPRTPIIKPRVLKRKSVSIVKSVVIIITVSVSISCITVACTNTIKLLLFQVK